MSYHWNTLKETIINKWSKLSHRDLDEFKHNHTGILNLIKLHYPNDNALPKDFQAILDAHGEKYYEKHPTSPRPLETSELQDEIGNFKRGPEVQAYEEKVEKIARDHVSDSGPFQG